MEYHYGSPLGGIGYVWDGQACLSLDLLDEPGRPAHGRDPVAAWLDAWFAGEILPLPPLVAPATDFQARLRRALLGIPFGETRSYGELARTLGTAPRALGQALKANPLPLLVPCHRVVGAHGIGGFSCGLAWKRRLLDFEASRRAVSVAEIQSRGVS